MGKLFNDTKTNLLMGLKLALFLPCNSLQFAINSNQLVMLLLLDLGSSIALGFLQALPDPTFDLYALPTYSLGLFVFFLLLFIATKIWKNPGLFLTLSILVMSVTPLLNVLLYLDGYLQQSIHEADSHYHLWGTLIAGYCIAILSRSLYIGSGRLKSLTAVTMLAIIAAGIGEYTYFGESQKFWYPAYDETEKSDPWAAYRAVDAEKLMYSQPDILSNALKSLKPQRDHVSDLFFVGFASYAQEDVFSKEVIFAKGVLDSRFGTQGHSINLINHLSSRESVPLANGTNLAAALKYIGAIMNKEEDVLMLYLTSHGSEDHELSVSFWPLALNGITPEKLRTMLDEAGIKWRVLLVSACYSGGFVEPLKNDQTLIATASATDKTSFGCGTKSEFTYFGEAVFKDMLPREYSLVSALEQARSIIEKREKSESRIPSLPQLSVGKAIKTKLDSLTDEFRLKECKSTNKGAVC